MTHGHFDHVGALEDLAREWDAPVYAHRLRLAHILMLHHYRMELPRNRFSLFVARLKT